MAWLWRMALIVVLVSSLALPVATAQDDDEATPAPPLVELNTVNIKQATVFLMQVVDTPAGPVTSCVGSGTLVSTDGLILTNAHVVSPSPSCQADRIVVALSLRVDEPAVPTYVAEILDANRGYDLAVLQITRFIDGRTVDRNTLKLPICGAWRFLRCAAG
ncbi:MAG: hypothetical protein HC915_09120 [Anaerolineae bacterium]|nr:hypothetical protein [Anaerolineae bacterium]